MSTAVRTTVISWLDWGSTSQSGSIHKYLLKYLSDYIAWVRAALHTLGLDVASWEHI